MDKPIFNLHITYGDAFVAATRFRNEHPELHVWDDPRNFYNESITIRTDEFFPTKTFDKNLEEMYVVGTVEKEAKAALLWLMQRHKGFNPLELGQIIVGVKHPGFGEDTIVAIFAYLSKADDCLRDFITELASELTP